jgi:hypothetical protein
MLVGGWLLKRAGQRKTAHVRREGGLELTRFRGHLIIWETGVHDVKSKRSLSAGIPAADD